MTNTLERILSIVVAAAALVVAALFVRREFSQSGQRANTTNAGPTFVKSWREAIPIARFVGAESARVKLIEFADLECPFCAEFNRTSLVLRKRFSKDLAVGFVHLPLPNHRFARPAAHAAECALGQNRFAEFVDATYRLQDSLGLVSWTRIAKEAGISDTVSFGRCIVKQPKMQAVEAGVSLAERWGVRGTPTVVLNGWRYSSPPSESVLVRDIATLLAGKRPY